MRRRYTGLRYMLRLAMETKRFGVYMENAWAANLSLQITHTGTPFSEMKSLEVTIHPDPADNLGDLFKS